MNSMLRTELFARAAFAFITALACALPVNSSAQKTGTGAVELIVPFGPGGGADTLGRATAKQLSAILAEPIQVINVPGATGRQGIGKLIAAPADGHTLAVLTADTFTLQAYSNPRWKLSDVIPLGIMMKQPSALLLPSNSRFKTWGERRSRSSMTSRTSLMVSNCMPRSSGGASRRAIGLATNLERLIAQDQLLTAQLQYVSEQFTRKVSYLNLLRATGSLRTALEQFRSEQTAGVLAQPLPSRTPPQT